MQLYHQMAESLSLSESGELEELPEGKTREKLPAGKALSASMTVESPGGKGYPAGKALEKLSASMTVEKSPGGKGYPAGKALEKLSASMTVEKPPAGKGYKLPAGKALERLYTCKKLPVDMLGKLQDQVTCAICLQLYREPKILPCFHTFCRECLEGVAGRVPMSTITCPICRHDTSVPAGGVAELRSAFHINNLLEIECDLKHAVSKEAVNMLGENKMKKKEIKLCKLHEEEERNLFCEECHEFICLQCTISSHNGHQYDLVETVVALSRSELIKSLEPVQQEMDRIETCVENVREKSAAITAQEAKIEAQVEEMVTALQDALEMKRQAILDSLHKLAQTKQSVLESDEHEHMTLLNHLRRCVRYVRELVEQGQDEETILEKGGTEKMVDVICRGSRQHMTSMTPQEHPNMAVIPANLDLIVQGIQNMVVVTTYRECPQNCHVIGGNVRTANMGEMNVITVHVADQQHKPCKEGMLNPINYEGVSEVSGRSVRGHAQHRKDATYRISYLPVTKGVNSLSITINGEHIAASPWRVMVRSTLKDTGEMIGNITTLKHPCAVAFRNDEILAVSNRDQGIIVMGQDGRLRNRFNDTHFTAVAVGDEGCIYATDCTENKVLKFSPEGVLTKMCGGHGTHKWPLKFNHPVGIAFNPHNRKLYIADAYNQQIQVLNSDLTFHQFIEEKGPGFQYPLGVGCCADRIFIADSENDRVQVFTARGKFVRMFGQSGEGPGDLKRPVGIAVDADNYVYVSEAGNDRVSVFTARGKFVKSFGEGLKSPQGIAVHSDSGLVCVCNYGQSNIQVY